MYKKILVVLIVIFTLSFFSGCLQEQGVSNEKPVIEIEYPKGGATVSNLIMISGVSSDPDGNETVEQIEISINDGEWKKADGVVKWSYELNTYELEDGYYIIKARAWDGQDYSEIKNVEIKVNNPEQVETDSHRWALFVISANIPDVEDESKLGNGGLNLAEKMSSYLVEKRGYSTSNIFILFDDGWIRENNGKGARIKTLHQRQHEYDFNYGGATKQNLKTAINKITSNANQYENSEVFIWMYGHGYGNNNNTWTGGKLLETSEIYLWDSKLSDKELGEMLSGLEAKETCVIVDACFSGGFADKTIYNFPEFFLFKSGLTQSGRVIITGASKFKVGYASTTQGPLFSLLWFEGIKTGDADGFKPGFLNRGRPTRLNLFKDGKVSVEEAFYYAKYMIREEEELKEYSKMFPQINDQYPRDGLLGDNKGMFLGE